MPTLELPKPNSTCAEPTETLSLPASLSERERVAIELYAQEQVSQEIAALIAGLSRSEFLVKLAEAKVPAFQYSIEEDFEEAMRIYDRRMGHQR